MPSTSSLNTADAVARLRRLRRLADLLDSRWGIPGTPWRIGVDGLASLIPVVGDTATAVFSAWIVLEARRLGAPPSLLARMAMNVGLDWAVGSIPVAGTIFDVAWKANAKNVDLLIRHLEETELKGS
ncbi:MAG TPA: DUF4112 domain-containing protein [Azospirillaceae bacterium]|nr:DUF4112 domain-containing protein [Azospirillaceae bacterium]